MTAQNILDEYYPPLSKYKKRVERNNELTDEEVSVLYKFVDNFEEQEEKFDWINEIDSIIPIIKRFQSTDVVSVTTNKAGTIPKSPKATPFLITQVLFYLGVACSFYNDISASKVLDVLKDKGLNLSHNFYTKLNLNSYVEMLKYHQPEMLFNYNGAKHKELGVALKNLVYQAGAYNTFVDIFGGSGSASLAFPRRRNSAYVYNDLDSSLVNLIEILADDKKHLELIDYLKHLQKDLCGEEKWVIGVDLIAEAKKYYNNRINQSRAGKGERELGIISDLYSKIEFDSKIIPSFMNDLYTEILDNQKLYKDFGKLPKNKEIYEAFDKFLNVVYDNYVIDEDLSTTLSRYNDHYEYICYFIHWQTLTVKLPIVRYITKDGNTEELTILEHNERQRLLRLYSWYAYFSNILDDILKYSDNIENYNKILVGVASVFINSYLTMGSADLSGASRTLDSMDNLIDGSKSNAKEQFIKKDFEFLITKLHNRLRTNEKLLTKRWSLSERHLNTRMVITCEDCIDLIKKYSAGSNVLFYSDSPYINTVGYKFKFDTDNMKDLIYSLENSGHKFIFSCRACLSGVNTTKERNKELFDNLFKVFQSKKLWVLTIGNDFWKQVKTNKIAEIMITNYEIHSFTDRKYKKVKFEVYDYNTFMNLLEKNINK